MKKIFAILTSVILAILLVSCSNTSNEDEISVWYLAEQDIEAEELFADANDTVDPSQIYNSIEYNEQMFYGVYTLNNEDKDIKQVRKNISFNDVEFLDGTYTITSLPICVSSGSDYICNKVRNYIYDDFKNATDIEVAVLEFATQDDIGTAVCSYEVNGNKITYQVLEQTSEDGETLEYENDLPTFEYEFSITGPYLTLSNGSESITLTGYSFTENANAGDIWLSGYSQTESPLVDDLDYISAREGILNLAATRSGGYYDQSAVKISDDGLITIYLNEDSENDESATFHQYAYITNCSGLSSRFTVILLDSEKEYYYTDSIASRESRILSEDSDISELSEDDIEEIAEKKSDLFDDLYNEFQEAGINADINRSTGEIALDSTVLFGGDSAVVTDDGKEFLNKFLKAYTDIIYNEKYDGFISKTVIEGHIAPVDGVTYESGLPFSEERAENVKEYCLSGDTGVDTTKLAQTLETVGYSQSKPVYDSDGNIDYDASRRVSFKFVVNTD